MVLKHPEYAHGISDAELIKEAIEFCDAELDGFEGMDYDSDSEVCCQRSNTFIRELVLRTAALSSRPAQEAVAVTAEEHNAAFDPANDALGGAFKDGFREGWLFASDPGFDNREELEGDYQHVVDIAPSECWDAYRGRYFAMLPLAAIPTMSAAPHPVEAAAVSEWISSVRNVGTKMANTLYNLRQRSAMTSEERETVKRVVDAWDAIPMSPASPSHGADTSARAAQSVEVKPLEWNGNYGRGVLATYHVSGQPFGYPERGAGFYAVRSHGLGSLITGPHDTRKEAEQSADTDYERLVRSALSTPEPSKESQ